MRAVILKYIGYLIALFVILSMYFYYNNKFAALEEQYLNINKSLEESKKAELRQLREKYSISIDSIKKVSQIKQNNVKNEFKKLNNDKNIIHRANSSKLDSMLRAEFQLP